MRAFWLAAAMAGSMGLADGAAAQDVKFYFYDVHGRLIGAAHTRTGVSQGYGSYSFDSADNRRRRDAQTVALRAVQNELRPGETLVPQSSLVALDGRSQLVLQADGNVVLYVGSTPKWAANTGGRSALRLEMQGDGNLVLYDPATAPLWYAATSTPGARLILQNDCNAVIYSSSSAALWSTGTQC